MGEHIITLHLVVKYKKRNVIYLDGGLAVKSIPYACVCVHVMLCVCYESGRV